MFEAQDKLSKQIVIQFKFQTNWESSYIEIEVRDELGVWEDQDDGEDPDDGEHDLHVDLEPGA